MSSREADARHETRVVYTCWPFGPEGHTVCGVLMLIIGGAILAERLLPGSAELVWGAALLLAGVWMMSRAGRNETRS